MCNHLRRIEWLPRTLPARWIPGLRQERDYLVAEIGGLSYPVRDGIPVMLVEEARLPQGIATLDEFKEQFKDHIPAS